MSTDEANPDIQWALNLLSPDPYYQENFISKNFHWIFWPTSAVGGMAYTNWLQRKPLYASLPRYAIGIACSLVIAKVLKDAKTHRESERDTVLRHYIKLHPELFPEPERKTYNQSWDNWTPCR